MKRVRIILILEINEEESNILCMSSFFVCWFVFLP